MGEKKSDEIMAKAEMDENVVVQQDLDMSAWECMKANPKIIFWTLYANSKSQSHRP